jgi:Ca2+-binding RTX toxin-like protein
MTEPVLYVDTNFVADLFGRTTWTGTTGVALLDNLDTKYDIRLTTTVEDELDQEGYELQATWFTSAGITATNTDAYSLLTNGGERSIASIIDPDYVDAALGATTNYDSSLPSLASGNLLVGSSDSWFTGNGYGSITVSSQTIMGGSLVDGTVSLDDYNSYISVNTGSLVISSPENVIADNLTDMGVSAGVDGSGNLTVGGDIVPTADGLHYAVAANTMVPLAQDAETTGDVVAQAQDIAQIAEAIKPDDVALGVVGTDALASHLAVVTAEGGASDTLAAVLAGLSGITGVAAVGVVEIAVAEHLGLIDDTDTDNLVSNYYWGLTNPSDVLKEAGMEIGDGFHALSSAVSSAFGLFGDGEGAASPLVIDLSSGHTGITLTTFNAATTATFYDIEGTGFAQQTAWTSGDTGFLVRENIDGSISLFGSTTVDGFAKLAALDSNSDLKIDSHDSAWSSLAVWVDANGNGVVDSGELQSLASAGLASIDLASVAPSTDVIDGNQISHTSTVTFTDGDTAEIGDAWFVHSTVNTVLNGSYNLDLDTLFLPDLRGYGTVADLDVAMSQDSTLKTDVSDFASGFTLDSLADPSTLTSDITSILYQWAGVESVDPASRGTNVNAQDLESLEHFFGFNFIQASSGSPDPQQDASSNIEAAWQSVLNTFAADILVQVGAGSIFDGPVTYNPWTGALDGTIHLSESGISDLATHAPGTELGAEAFWTEVANFIDHTEGISSLDTDEQSWLNTAVSSTATIGWSDIVNLYDGTNPGTYVTGTSGNDTLNGGDGDDYISSGAGNDIVYAGSGNDTIYTDNGTDTINGDAGNDTITAGNGNDVITGGDGNDVVWAGTGSNTIDGGAGNDEIHGGNGGNVISGGTGGNFLYGGSGNDTFIFGGGDDVISSAGGSDQIILPSGIVLGDLGFTRGSSDGSTTQFNDLLITVASGGSIQIVDHFLGSGYEVPTLVFNDSSTLDLTTLTAYTTVLTSADDEYSPGLNIDQTVYGQDGADVIVTGSGNDTLDGGNGNDILESGGGTDTYIASPGFDTIEENGAGGTDTIVIPTGYSLSDVTFSRHIGLSGPDDDLIINIRGLGEIQIEAQFYSSAYAIENLYFTDGASTISLTDQVIQSIGTTGDDTISGLTSGVGGNWFDGRGGNDAFTGGIGDNTFVFAAGFGNDTVDLPYHTGNTNTVSFEGVNPANVRMWTDSSGNLHLQDTTDSTHSITIDAGTTGSGIDESAIGTYLEQIKFDDAGSTTWDLTGGLTITGTSSGETLYGTAHNDTLYSMGGNDTLYGNGGNDTYVIPSNFGNVAIHEALSGGTDTVHLSGLNPSDVVIYTDSSGNLLIQKVGDASNTITLYGGLSGGYSTIGSYIESIAFDNGTTWDLTSGHIQTVTGASYTTLTGTTGSDILTLGTGGGTINASDGNDILNGGSGGDSLNGGNGNDVLTGNGGTDYLYGNAGNDTYVFASGWGTDAVHENLSEGTDTIHFSGIAPSDIRMYTDASGMFHFVQISNPSDTIAVYAGLTGSNTSESTIGSYVESVTFDSTYATTWDLTGGLTLTGDNSGDYIYGTAYSDVITGGTGLDYLYGNAGNDTLVSGGGNDQLYGGPGNDTYTFTSGFGNAVVHETVSQGTDTIHFAGIAPSDIRMYTDAYGALHLVQISSPSHNITINAGLTGSNTSESTIGSYVESVTFDSTYATTWDLTGGLVLTGDNSGDYIYGTAYGDTITGGTGADYLYGNAGNDTLIGGAGNDQLYGGPGDDTYAFSSGFANATVHESTGQGTDAIHFTGIDPADIRMWTDSYGTLYLQDTLDTSHHISVNAGIVSGTTESTIGSYVESVTFDSSYATTWDLTGGLALTGDNSGDYIYGTAYNDVIKGGTGLDYLYGNDGNDTLIGGAGNDQLYGGTGNDTYVFSSGFGNAVIHESLSQGSDTIHFTGLDPADIRMWTDSYGTLYLQNTLDPSHSITVSAGVTGNNTSESTIGSYVESVTFDSTYATTWDLTGGLTLTGTSSAESLYGTANNDTINGMGGADTLYGNAGNDNVNGGSAVDHLYGGPGDDVLYGGGGADTVTGGTGADTFLFKAATALGASVTIADFTTAQSDKIDIADVLDGHYDPVHDAIADFVSLTTSGSNTLLKVDLDGTGGTYSPTQIATLTGVTGLNLNDLITDGNLVVHHT